MKQIIAITGNAGSGKDTIANYLCDKHNFVKYSFAEPLKHIVSIMTGWSYEFLNGDVNRELRETAIHPDFDATPRQLLQQVGTEVFRDHFDKEIWVKIMKRRIMESSENIVISDCRFENEVDMVSAFPNVKIIALSRSTSDINLSNKGHASEMQLNLSNRGRVYTVNNDGSINDLLEKVEIILHSDL